MPVWRQVHDANGDSRIVPVIADWQVFSYDTTPPFTGWHLAMAFAGPDVHISSVGLYKFDGIEDKWFNGAGDEMMVRAYANIVDIEGR